MVFSAWFFNSGGYPSLSRLQPLIRFSVSFAEFAAKLIYSAIFYNLYNGFLLLWLDSLRSETVYDEERADVEFVPLSHISVFPFFFFTWDHVDADKFGTIEPSMLLWRGQMMAMNLTDCYVSELFTTAFYGIYCHGVLSNWRTKHVSEFCSFAFFYICSHYSC